MLEIPLCYHLPKLVPWDAEDKAKAVQKPELDDPQLVREYRSSFPRSRFVCSTRQTGQGHESKIQGRYRSAPAEKIVREKRIDVICVKTSGNVEPNHHRTGHS